MLSGRAREGVPLRPPWSLSEARFTALCSRCDDCVTVCPSHILQRGDGGFPVVDFSRAACTFCAECVRVCKTGALAQSEASSPWSVRAHIGDACLARQKIECRICGEACDEGAIHFRPSLGGVSLPALDAAACTGCGACVASCPVRVIECRAADVADPVNPCLLEAS